MENEPFDPDTVFGKSKPFDYWLNKEDNPLVYCILHMNGKKFIASSSYEVTLHQKTNKHDCFTIKVPSDAIDDFKDYVMAKSRQLIGNEITINYHQYGRIRQTFFGIIDKVQDRRDGSGYGDIVLKGKSPAMLLDSGKKCRSFDNKTLEEIINEVCSKQPPEAKVKVTPLANNNIPKRIAFTVQYQESDYKFIQRLAKLHGEYFYYNGENLIFGTETQPRIKISEGVDLDKFHLKMKLKAQLFSHYTYDSESGTGIEKHSENAQSNDLQNTENIMQAVAVIKSEKLFAEKSKMYFNHTGNDAESDLTSSVIREKERRQRLVKVKGESRNSDLRIGGMIEVSDINDHAMETYRIIEVKHIHNPGEYYNEFTAIPDMFNAPYQDNNAVPKCEEQSARVVDNNDPKGMKRVRVQFEWQKENNQITPWIDVVSPHAGAGKGHHFVPEIGEEVLVAFRSGNAENPYVVGALYNGAETSGFHTENNDLKVIKTRSGIEQIYNDAEGSWKQSTPDGNFIYQDGQGNININATKNLNINVGENFNINVGQNVSFLVGLRAIYNIGMQMMMNTPILRYFITDNYHLQSPKTLINGEGEIKIEAKETNVAGTEKLLMHSEESTVVNSKGIVSVKGQDGTHNDNNPLDFELSTTEEIAKAIAYFRTVEGKYNGEFGYDWNRKADNGLTKEAPYQNLITEAYRQGATEPVSQSESYQMFKNQYYQIPIIRSGIRTEETYETPILQIFSQTFVQTLNLPKGAIEPSFKAELRVLIEIEENLDRLEFEYDKNFFTIDKTILKKKDKTKGLEDSNEKIIITCLQDITTDFLYISLYAYPKNSKDPTTRTLAGKIKVLKNDATARRHLNITYVAVKTKIEKSGKTGNCNDKEKFFLQKALHQCLITCTATEGPLLDLTTDNEFKVIKNTAKQEIYGRFIYKKEDANNTKVTDKKINEDADGIFDYIKALYLQQNQQGYSDKLLVFAFGESTYDTVKIVTSSTSNDGEETTTTKTSTIAGIAPINGKIAFLFLGENGGKRKNHTMAHEVLHSLGVYHLHKDNEAPYIRNRDRVFLFKYKTTDNIMAYDVEGKTVMQWQWNITRRNILITNLPPVKPPKTDKK